MKNKCKKNEIVIRIHTADINATYYGDGSGQIELSDFGCDEKKFGDYREIYFADNGGIERHIKDMSNHVKKLQRHIKVFQKAIKKLKTAKKKVRI